MIRNLPMTAIRNSLRSDRALQFFEEYADIRVDFLRIKNIYIFFVFYFWVFLGFF